MDGNERYALLMELANMMIEMGHSVKGASLDEHGVCLETEQGGTEVRIWVTVKKAEQQG